MKFKSYIFIILVFFFASSFAQEKTVFDVVDRAFASMSFSSSALVMPIALIG